MGGRIRCENRIASLALSLYITEMSTADIYEVINKLQQTYMQIYLSRI